MQRNSETGTADILDGRKLAVELRIDLSERVRSLAAQGVVPTLAVVLVGQEDPSSSAYVQTIARIAGQVGIAVTIETAPGDTTNLELGGALRRLSADPKIHGLILQQPLPVQLNAAELVGSIIPEKDVDGANPATQGLLALGRTALFTPATPRAVMELLRRSAAWPIVGKHAVVIGKSNVVGIPVALLLMHAGATVTVTHKDTVDLASHVRRAEIIVSAAGVPGLVTREMLRAGVTIIDVGTTFVGDKLCGDVDAAAAEEFAADYTPVPGGVGPVTTATLLANVVESAERCIA